MGKYHISVDDCIVFLQDLNQKNYQSIFENEFLSFIQSIHNQYQTCFSLNLFFSNQTSQNFKTSFPLFTLKDMKDQYKKEFIANASWLKLSFHAKYENPPFPYQNSNYPEVFQDVSEVNKEIQRFAGKETLSKEMSLHYGTCTKEGFLALKDAGYQVFYGYLTLQNNQPFNAYFFDTNFLKEHPENLFSFQNVIFKKTDFLFNAYSDVKTMEKDLEKVLADNQEIYEFMFHEQYFYSNYVSYIPNYQQIIRRVAQIMQQKGHTSGFLK